MYYGHITQSSWDLPYAVISYFLFLKDKNIPTLIIFTLYSTYLRKMPSPA